MTAITAAPPAVHRTGAWRARVGVAGLVAALAATAVATAPTERPVRAVVAPPAIVDPGIPAAGLVEVVVQGRAGGDAAALADGIRRAGGEVARPLPMVDGFEVRIDASDVDALAGQAGVHAVTLDRDVTFETISYDEAGTASAFVGASRAGAAWRNGNIGKGVGVAVVDTGISEMPDFAGRLVHGPDLSGEGTLVDTYGHGTVMAGIIGGSGAASAGRTGGAYTGIAPGAHLVGVKVAGANGAADVSTLLQALHWVSAYRQQLNIRVLNLSWGTPSTQSPALDPMNYAVQRLWQEGVVVVVAAGNSGPSAGTVMKPGDDPLAITVGAFNDNGTAGLSDDEMVSWSSAGPTAQGLAKPDLVASGRRVVAQRSHGSTVVKENPKALVDATYIRGSGSSQAAAVVSGAAALLLAARPELTPDQVKSLLTRTADPMTGVSTAMQGRGRLDVAEALTIDPGPAQWQTATASGLGSIDASRGGRRVQTDCGQDGTIEVIQGEIDVRCEPWNGSAWTGSAWTGSAWTGSAWTGSAWTGSAWTGSAWTGSAWTGSAWTGGTWTGSAWTGSAWTGSAWTGSAWTGSAWTGSAWTGSAWTGSAWTGSAWTTGEYDEELFFTAWWGVNPPAGTRIPGERFIRTTGLPTT